MPKTPRSALRPLSAALLVAVLAACGDKTPPATDAATTPPTPAADTAAATADTSDPTVINAPLAQDSVLTDIRLASAPEYLADTDELVFKVKVGNAGSAVISGQGEMPVVVGVVHVDPDQEIFASIPVASRESLPVLRSGDSGVVSVTVAAESILGLPLHIELFQQGVAFFGKSYGQPVVTVGPFARCNGAAATLCNADGTAISN